jgi:Raf kinase inhibitor-like YbhB/YbcL family protein
MVGKDEQHLMQNRSLPVIRTTHFGPQHHRMRGIDRDLIRGQRRRRGARSGGPFFMWMSSNSKMAHKNPDLTHGGEMSDIPFQRAHADFASTDFGSDGYGGPCPPPGDKPHHYQITVFAVDVDKLPAAKDHSASAALVGFDLKSHTLAKATLTGMYGR